MRIGKRLFFDRLWPRAPVVAVLRFDGVIMGRPRRGGVSLESHAAAIDRAFRVANLVAVAIVVNSPGGSAVQSALLFRRIRELADEKQVPVIAFAEDVAASSGVFIPLGSANPCSTRFFPRTRPMSSGSRRYNRTSIARSRSMCAAAAP